MVKKKPVVEKRRYQRFPVELQARFNDGRTRKNNSCKIVEISLDGLVLSLDTNGTKKIGPAVFLEIECPSHPDPLNAFVQLHWLREIEDNGISAGSQFKIIKNEDRNSLMNYAYASLLQKEIGTTM